MNIELICMPTPRKAKKPAIDSDYVVVDGACPECKTEPFKVAGRARRISEDDRHWEADGVCLHCGRGVGILRVGPVETIFGLREDVAVLGGKLPLRVY